MIQMTSSHYQEKNCWNAFQLINISQSIKFQGTAVDRNESKPWRVGLCIRLPAI